MKEPAISSLKDGLYEKILSKEFQTKLQEALDAKEIWTDQEALDPQEAVHGLSVYLQHLFQSRLKELADELDIETADKEIDFTNECIRFYFVPPLSWVKN